VAIVGSFGGFAVLVGLFGVGGVTPATDDPTFRNGPSVGKIVIQGLVKRELHHNA
jgi:hypothetical protein